MITVKLDQYDRKLLTRLLGAAMGNTLNPEANIAPKVGTGLEFTLLLDLLGRVNGMEAKKNEQESN
jgi:hypothetical protein